MVKVRIYAEGGGERGQQKKGLDIKARQAFSKFFINAKIPGGRFSVTSCGSRNQAYKCFCNAIQDGKSDIPLLLVDSEADVQTNFGPWAHLYVRDKWKCPDGAKDMHAHLMVQCMENWFLADRKKVEDYYRDGFQASALPVTLPVENAMKADVLSGLSRASKNTKKGPYSKGDHSFSILETLDPQKVAQASYWACWLLETMEDVLDLPERMWADTAKKLYRTKPC